VQTTFIAYCGGEALLFQHCLEGVKNLGDRAQALAECVEALGHDHEFLKVDRSVRVGAAVDDVGHRHRQHLGVGAAKVLVQRQAKGIGCGMGVGHRHGEDGVGPELGLGGSAVQSEHGVVDGQLVGRVDPLEYRCNFFDDVVDGLVDAFAEVTALDAVAQFERLIHAGAGAAGHGRAAKRSSAQADFHFNCRVAS